MYAIGGSSNPTILSEGNFYIAPNDDNAKQVDTLYHEIQTNTYIIKLNKISDVECGSWMTDYQEGSEGKLEELEMEVF